MSGGRAYRAPFGGQRLEVVRDIRIYTRVSLNEFDLVVTSVAAFIGGWILGYLTTLT